jgi:3'-5' exoribonuclease
MLSDKTPYKVVAISEGTTKTGKPFYNLTLKDMESAICYTTMVWEQAILKLETKKILKLNNTIIPTILKFSNNSDLVSLEDATLIKEGVLGISKEVAKIRLKELTDILLKHSENGFYPEEINFILEIFDIYDEKILSCPAAKKHHHNYVGGLLAHTWECWYLANQRARDNKIFGQQFDVPLLEIAAIAHDLFKLEEYSINPENGAITYQEEWTNLHNGHVLYGYAMFMMRDCEKLANIILSHHGSEGKDYNGLTIRYRTPTTIEEIIMHNIDMQSSTEGTISIDILEEK